MITVGTIIKCNTTTLNNTFGEVVYEITRAGMPAPEEDRKGQMDGVIATMLGGNGPAARRGFTVVDSVWSIEKDIQDGKTEILPSEKKAAIVAYYDALDKQKKAEREVGM
jgi:hypothetical protein